MQALVPTIYRHTDHFRAVFVVMATPCELLVETDCETTAKTIIEKLVQEAQRIEQKYSRYRVDNIVYEINHAQGKPVILDIETFHLLTFANTCFELSEGLFDITAGVLNQIWDFSPDTKPPSEDVVNETLKHVGWQKVTLTETTIELPEHMAIDLGAIAKEYGVDRCSAICQEQWPDVSVLINFGGDIAVSNPRHNAAFWQVGIESADPHTNLPQLVQISKGGMATTGDAKRYIEHNGIRYSHIINPMTGYALTNAPRSVTVSADNCTQAGLLSTLAVLNGPNAHTFLLEQGVAHWVVD